MHPARAETIAQLEATLPPGRVRLHPYPTSPALEPRRPWPVVVGLDGVTPIPSVVHGRAYQMGLVLICPATSAKPGSIDELDDRLEELLRAIDETDRLTWDQVEAVAWGDQIAPAYRIQCTLHATRQE